MSNYIRKLKRNFLKRALGTNKINQAYHDKYDSIEKLMRRAKREGLIKK